MKILFDRASYEDSEGVVRLWVGLVVVKLLAKQIFEGLSFWMKICRKVKWFRIGRNILIWTDFLYCVVHDYFNFGRVFLMFVRTEDSVHVVKLWLESISKNILTET